MALSDRVKKIDRFFQEMQVLNLDGKTVIYIRVSFPHGWVIADDIEEKYGVNVSPGKKSGEYFFIADISDGEETVFDAVEYNIAKMNEAIERATLLSEKTLELKRMFENEDISIEVLRTIKITMDNAPGIMELPASKRGKKRGRQEERKNDTTDIQCPEDTAENNQNGDSIE